MRRRYVIPTTLFVLFALCFSCAVYLQHRALQKVLKNPPFLETWLVTSRSAERLKLVSLNYDLVMSDFLWLRSIQSFGGRGMTNRDWQPLYNLFDTITELDPQFESAYTFGNLVLGDEGGYQDKGLELLNKGLYKTPGRYRIPYEGMYVSQWQLNDTNLARWYGRIAVKRKNAPDWLPRIVAYLDVESGNYYVGYNRAIANLLLAMDSNEPIMEEIAVNKITETLDKWSKRLLGRAVDEYTSATGRTPSSLDDVADQPALRGYEIGDIRRLVGAVTKCAQDIAHRGLYADTLKLVPGASDIGADQSVGQTSASKSAKNMMAFQDEVFKQSLVKRNGIPEAPGGSRYVLNLTLAGRRQEKLAEAVQTEAERALFLKELIEGVRAQIELRKQELGRLPESLHEVFQTDFVTTEPCGGKWFYDPKTGDFWTSTQTTE